MGARGTVRRPGVAVAAVLAAALLGVAAPVGAAAAAGRASDCDAVVVDGARMLGRGAAVTRAAAAVAAHRATVRVRTYSSVGRGDLDAAVAAETSRCASWRGRDGRRRADLVVLAVSLADRRTGIYYGSGWAAALDDRQEEVQTGTVNPLLRRGKHAAAVAGGLTAIEELLPARPGQAPAVAVKVGAAGDLPPATDAPPDPVARSLDALFPVIVVGCFVAGVVALVSAARDSRRQSASHRHGRTGETHGQGGGSTSVEPSGFSGSSDGGSASSSSSSDGGGSSTSW